MKAVKVFVLSALIVATAWPLSAKKYAPYDSFYVFGDSLVDTGNLQIATGHVFAVAVPPSTSPHRAYYEGRFSNGPVAVEYLWELLIQHQSNPKHGVRPSLAAPGLGHNAAVNFAFGGSGTGLTTTTPDGSPVPGLRGQVETFRLTLNGSVPSPHALYAIVSGANDYLRAQPLSPMEVVGNISNSIQMLYGLGARDIVVVNMPDLGQIPLTARSIQSSSLSLLSAGHNGLLAATVQGLASHLPGVDLTLIDVNDVFRSLPAGMNTTIPAMDALVPLATNQRPVSFCLFDIQPGATCPNIPTFDVGQRFLFWDAEHPTTSVHRLLGEYIYGRLIGQ
jgi:phospholipase/lecithinase/hemolysin